MLFSSLHKYLLCLLLILALHFTPGLSEAGQIKLLPPQELDRLGRSVKILDARPVNEWRSAHIPGAVSLAWQDYIDTRPGALPYQKLPVSVIAARLGKLGIDEQSPVAVYGDADSSWGGEGWVCWLLNQLGHSGDIYLLDGGIQAWSAAVGLLSKEKFAAAPPVEYHFVEQKGLEISTADLHEQNDLQLVDTRSLFEWLRGSIPGAVRISWTKFYSGKERRPVSRDEMLALLEENGIDPQKPVVYFCSGGIRSAYAWMVHELAGLQTAKNYEGGMAAWRVRKDLLKEEYGGKVAFKGSAYSQPAAVRHR